jgi:hypothetical protein
MLPITGGEVLLMTETKEDAITGEKRVRVFQHQPILVGVNHDGPAEAKLRLQLSSASFLGCASCLHNGTNDHPVMVNGVPNGQTRKGSMHFLGYDKPVRFGMRGAACPHKMALVGDPSVYLSHDAQVRVYISLVADYIDKSLYPQLVVVCRCFGVAEWIWVIGTPTKPAPMGPPWCTSTCLTRITTMSTSFLLHMHCCMG